MIVSRTVLNALNVRREEWWLVRKLFALQFFQHAGIAFFYTAASVRFLHSFPIEDLAYLYILTAAMLMVTGFAYSRLEHYLGISKTCTLVTALMAGSMILYWMGAAWTHAPWFSYAMFGWFYVLYLLNNLSFWGLASQLYDVRQSKRLFAVISAGEIPAKFIGYTAALLIISASGIDNLLIVGCVCMVISYPYMRAILRLFKEELHHKTHHHKEKTEVKVSVLLKNYTVNKLVRRVAVMSLIMSACIILLTYAFYGEVKGAKEDDKALGIFIALFQALGSLTALLTKSIFASRIVEQMGHAKTLILTPVILISCMCLLILSGSTGIDQPKLYIFGFTFIIIDVLRTSINSPILLSLMQPLSTTERLRAHNIVKGFMDPFAYLLCGFFLLLLIEKHWDSLDTLTFVLLFVAIAWIVNILLVNKQYLRTLIKTVSSRYFTQEEFDLSDRETKRMVEQKISSGTELEVLYILNMLSTRKSRQNETLIVAALDHSSPKVVIEALKLVNDQKILAASSVVESLINNHPDIHVKSNAIKILAESGLDDSHVSGFLYHDNKELQEAAVIAIINGGSKSFRYSEAVAIMRSLVHSTDAQQNKEALSILRQLKVSGFEDEILELLSCDNAGIKVETIKAIGVNPSEKTLPSLFQYLNNFEKDVLESLLKSDVLSLPLIKTNLLSNKLTEKQKLNLIALCGRMEGPVVHATLFSLLTEMPVYDPAIIRALYKSQFKAAPEEKKQVEDLIKMYLVIAAEILHMHRRINPKKEVYELLHNSLQIELDDIKIVLLSLFSFLYDSDKINKIRSALSIQKKATIANAMELVDMTVKKDFARPFTVIFESGDIEHRCKSLKDLFPRELFPEVEQILHTILKQNRFTFNQWTMACSLYTSKKQFHKLDKNIVRKYIDSDVRLLKETAEFAL